MAMPSTKRSTTNCQVSVANTDSSDPPTRTARSTVYIASRPSLSVTAPKNRPPTKMPTRAAAPMRLSCPVVSWSSLLMPTSATPMMLSR